MKIVTIINYKHEEVVNKKKKNGTRRISGCSDISKIRRRIWRTESE